MSDSFYRDFEDLFRGSRELIKSRLRVYLPFVRRLKHLDATPRALDLGCGRGEWLEVLEEDGFDASGVDLDEEMLGACRERGLKASKADLLKTLPTLPSESVELISAFHVVEHIRFDDVRLLVREALRILKPGGLLILETPNPENLSVGATSFYMDPSHIRPLPSSLLDFAVAHGGFRRTKVLYLQESTDLRTSPEVRLIDVLNGVSPDYAVIGQKGATRDTSSGEDDPFLAEYGLSLGTLAQRYDVKLTVQMDERLERSERRAGQIEHRQGLSEIQLARAEDRMGKAETRVAQAEDRLDKSTLRSEQVASQIAQIEERLATAETRIAQTQRQMHDMLTSRSWRITAPLRWITSQARALRAIRLKAGAKPLLRHSARFVMARGWLSTVANAILAHYPSLRTRLRRVIHEPIGAMSTACAPLAVELAQLSPRARRIYAELKAKSEQHQKESR